MEATQHLPNLKVPRFKNNDVRFIHQDKISNRDVTVRHTPHPKSVRHIEGLFQPVCAIAEGEHGRLTNADHSQQAHLSRHTPQTKFVSLLKGLNDVPVCTVLRGKPIYRARSAFVKKESLERRVRESMKKVGFKLVDTIPKSERAQSCPEGLRVDEIGEFKVELVRRHNPHARRVCHIKGLNDVPVCVVRDELNAEWENRFIVSPGSLAPTYPRHRKNSSNVLARSNPDYIPPERASRASSRISVPKMSLVPPDHSENDLSDELDSIQALDILCGILQTNSLQTVQAWIDQATEEERLVVIRALRGMKEKGALGGPGGQNNLNLLAPLPEDKVSSVQYQSNWDQGKSTQNEEPEVKKEEPPTTPTKPPMSPKKPPVSPKSPKPPTSPVGTQTPVSVLKKSRASERPPTRIQMTGLSRPSTMKSVREKFMSGSQGSNNAAKDPGFSWTVKHKNSSAPDVASKA